MTCVIERGRSSDLQALALALDQNADRLKQACIRAEESGVSTLHLESAWAQLYSLRQGERASTKDLGCIGGNALRLAAMKEHESLNVVRHILVGMEGIVGGAKARLASSVPTPYHAITAAPSKRGTPAAPVTASPLSKLSLDALKALKCELWSRDEFICAEGGPDGQLDRPAGT